MLNKYYCPLNFFEQINESTIATIGYNRLRPLVSVSGQPSDFMNIYRRDLPSMMNVSNKEATDILLTCQCWNAC